MGTEDLRTSGYRGPVGTEDQRISGIRGPVGTEDQRKSGNRGHEGTRWDSARRHQKLLKSYGCILSYSYKVANHFPTLNLVFLYCKNII